MNDSIPPGLGPSSVRDVWDALAREGNPAPRPEPQDLEGALAALLVAAEELEGLASGMHRFADRLVGAPAYDGSYDLPIDKREEDRTPLESALATLRTLDLATTILRFADERLDKITS